MWRIGLVFLVACTRAPDAPSKPDPIPAKPEVAPVKKVPTPKLPPDVLAWWQPDLRDAWQGAWTTRLGIYEIPGEEPLSLKLGDEPGDPMAIEVTGRTVKAYNGRRDFTLELDITTPCSARLHSPRSVGEANVRQFAIGKDRRLSFGVGSAGRREGKKAIVCSALSWFSLVTIDDTRCVRWIADQAAGTWTSKSIDCAWGTRDGKDTLKLSTFGQAIGAGMVDLELVADGDVLLDYRLERDLAKRAADYATARATTRAWLVKHDPAERAKAAGGKVGDTSTVLGLWATFADARARVLGKPAELVGRVALVRPLLHDEQAVLLGDGLPWLVACRTKQKLTVKPGDRVRARGDIAMWQAMPSLEHCTITPP